MAHLEELSTADEGLVSIGSSPHPSPRASSSEERLARSVEHAVPKDRLHGLSCDNCKRLGVTCDVTTSLACGACIQHGVECTFTQGNTVMARSPLGDIQELSNSHAVTKISETGNSSNPWSNLDETAPNRKNHAQLLAELKASWPGNDDSGYGSSKGSECVAADDELTSRPYDFRSVVDELTAEERLKRSLENHRTQDDHPDVQRHQIAPGRKRELEQSLGNFTSSTAQNREDALLDTITERRPPELRSRVACLR